MFTNQRAPARVMQEVIPVLGLLLVYIKWVAGGIEPVTKNNTAGCVAG